MMKAIDMKDISFEELSSMTCEQIMELVEERKKESAVDIDAQRDRRMQRLSEQSMILHRETRLGYRELMISYDI